MLQLMVGVPFTLEKIFGGDKNCSICAMMITKQSYCHSGFPKSASMKLLNIRDV